VDYAIQAPIVRMKIAQSCTKLFGVIHPLQNKSIRDKTVETMCRRYGVTNSMFLPEVREKVKKTMRDKYGVDYPLQNPIVNAKATATRLARYGVEYPAQSQEIMDRIIGKRIKNQCLENRPQIDGLVFDSGWELEFYIFCKNRGLSVEYHPCSFEYSHNGKTHRYYPDFRVGDKLYEIKGDCFINQDGTWRSPFRREGSTDDEYADECARMEAKRQCILKHGVIIVSRAEMKNLEKVLCDGNV
jgi:hypothetical protein